MSGIRGDRTIFTIEAVLINDSDERQTAGPPRERMPMARRRDEPGVRDTLMLLRSRKRLILAPMLVCGLLATALSLLMPESYTATAVIMPPPQQSGGATALLNQLQLSSVANLASQGLGLKNPADLYIGILNSRTVADELVTQFRLTEVYQLKYPTDVRKALANRTTITAARFSLIQISVEDRIPQRAADMANAYVDRLQEQSSRLAVTEASQRRLFYERRMEREKARLAAAEDDFRKTQEQKGVYQVSSQVEAVIRSMAQMRAEIAAREVNLQRLKAGATAQNPEVTLQEIELTALRKQLQELEAGSAKQGVGDPLIPTKQVPAASLEYARRLREVKYRETLFELLAKQYELAEIEEAKEAPIVQVIDRAVLPDKKSSPVRSAYLAIGLMIGGFFGICMAFWKHLCRDQRVQSE
jgi:tyrosine-protein kinase Etk/Wzc